jgi:membrane protein implicated in regulation of membrane protease activity
MTALVSLVVGAIAMSMTHGLFVWLGRTDSSSTPVTDQELEGATGRVVLDVTESARGRIACEVGGKEVRVTARLTAGAREALVAGREVVVVRVSNGEAEVAPYGSTS